MTATTNGVLYNVRLANGASQEYQIVVPADIAPAKGGTWATPYLAHSKVSPRMAGVLAAAWAGGVSKKEKGGPPNSLVDVGSGIPGGFYNASSVRIESAQLQNNPIPYYLVRMTGQIGETRQTLYAAVLEDGRIIRPTSVSGPPQTTRSMHRKAHH
jgi:hypothetical protein